MSRTLEQVIAGFRDMSSRLGYSPTTEADPAFSTPAASRAAYNTPIADPGTFARGLMTPGVIPPYVSYNTANAFGAMGPPPAYSTPPAFGGMRPQMAPMSPYQTGVLPPYSAPMPAMPASMMTSPAGEFAAQFTSMQAYQHSVHQAAVAASMARVGVAGAGGFVGSALGMGVGAMLGGGAGARVGGMLGGAAGFYAGGFTNPGAALYGGIASGAVHDQLNSIRISEMTSRLGSGMGGNPMGAGLSHQDAMRVSQALSSFSQQSRGTFNRRDMMNIMQGATDNGLLDFAANSESIIAAVKSTSKIVLSMSRLTGDPDFRNAIRLMGVMRRMGVTPGEFQTAAPSLLAARRLTGVDVNSFMANEGMAGAATFQGAGLLGGVGAMTAMYGAGGATSMMRSGAMSATQFGLLGGESGMAQSTASAHALFGTGPGKLVTAAMLSGGNGALALDPAKIKALLSGGVDIQSMMGGAISNLTTPGKIGEFQMRGGELASDLMKQLGPAGVEALIIKLGQSQQKMMGGVMGLGPTLMNQLGMSGPEAQYYAQKASSPKYWQSQAEQTIVGELGERQARARESANQKSLARSNWSDRWDRLSISPFATGDGDDRAELDAKVREGYGLDFHKSLVSTQDTDTWIDYGRRNKLSSRGHSGGYKFGINALRSGVNKFRYQYGLDADSMELNSAGMGYFGQLMGSVGIYPQSFRDENAAGLEAGGSAIDRAYRMTQKDAVAAQRAGQQKHGAGADAILVATATKSMLNHMDTGLPPPGDQAGFATSKLYGVAKGDVEAKIKELQAAGVLSGDVDFDSVMTRGVRGASRLTSARSGFDKVRSARDRARGITNGREMDEYNLQSTDAMDDLVRQHTSPLNTLLGRGTQQLKVFDRIMARIINHPGVNKDQGKVIEVAKAVVFLASGRVDDPAFAAISEDYTNIAQEIWDSVRGTKDTGDVLAQLSGFLAGKGEAVLTTFIKTAEGQAYGDSQRKRRRAVLTQLGVKYSEKDIEDTPRFLNLVQANGSPDQQKAAGAITAARNRGDESGALDAWQDWDRISMGASAFDDSTTGKSIAGQDVSQAAKNALQGNMSMLAEMPRAAADIESAAASLREVTRNLESLWIEQFRRGH